MRFRFVVWAALAPLALPQTPPPPYVYVGDLGPTHALVAWGTANGDNTIGRTSRPMGRAVVRIDNRRLDAKQNWLRIDGLKPDTDYDYAVEVNGRAIGRGTLRTWPQRSAILTFFVIGDYGNGEKEQKEVAAAMRRYMIRRSQTDNPVRFIVTTGDNIYGKDTLITVTNSGSRDNHWGPRFFEPYRDIIQAIPFFPTLGNHDGNESEKSQDLRVYLDNFFFPGGQPHRYYRFSYGAMADFFALDSTRNYLKGIEPPGFEPESPQTKWLEQELAASRAPWKIAYFHHPPFTGGPHHDSSLKELGHWVELFKKHNVQAVFNGHEHNLQIAAKTELTGNVQYVVTGSGGQLRDGDISRTAGAAGIDAWTAQRHFLQVEIDGDTMRVSGFGPGPVTLQQTGRQPVAMPLIVRK